MSLGFRIKPTTSRADPHLVSQLSGMDPADLSDVLKHSTTMTGLRPLPNGPQTVCGSAVTVSLPLGGVAMLKAALDQCQEGDVLVVAARGATNFAMFGGTVAKAMVNRGLAGLVVDGAIRDADDIAAAGLPTFAVGETSVAALKDAPGEINVPVACAGVVVNPGDIVVGGPNGVVVVRPDQVESVVEAVSSLQSKFGSWADDVEKGNVPGLDGIYELLEKSGCDLSELESGR